jgi:hypothetical protein
MTMTNLSPAAQAVLNAVTIKRYDVPYFACPKSIDQIKSDVVAALRAAADQVVPESYFESDDVIRVSLLAIAAELESADA